MEVKELSLLKFNRPREGMALPLALVFLLFGGVLVAVAMYVVVNMHSTTEESVTHMELYNAAQQGVEKAMNLLWENRKELEEDALTYTGNIEDIYARLDDGTVLGPITFTVAPGISVEVKIFDCNYVLGSGQSFSDELPPQWPGGSGGSGSGGYLGPPSGTSVIIDPSRLFSFGGGSGGKRMAIRSKAEKEGVNATIEAMVEVIP
jgi:hypothetical protein